MPEQHRYVVAGYRPWNRRTFDGAIAQLPGKWHFVAAREELTIELLEGIRPDYVFFLHWSWKVPSEIVRSFECVNFHMTDLPFGRGGSPLQNLILRGLQETKLSAIRMTDEMDAGPVYLKEPMTLDGTAERIYERASDLAASMVERIVTERITPVPQEGEPTIFKRRTPVESKLPADLGLSEVYDFIRMLDADGYPRAFVEHDGLRLELSEAELNGDRVEAHVTVSLPASEAS